MNTSRPKIILASITWILITLFLIAIFIGNMSVRWTTLQASTGTDQVLLQVEFITVCLTALTSLTFTYLIFKRQTFTWTTLFITLLLLTTGMPLLPNFAKSSLSDEQFRTLNSILILIREIILIGTLCLFPDGRITPRWLKWVIPILIPVLIVIMIVPMGPAIRIIFDPVRYALYILVIGSQLYRYRQASNALQRQQLKWILVALAINLLGRVITPTLQSLYGTEEILQNNTLLRLVLAILPDVFLIVAFGIATLRYRLWDITFFINQALVYSSLTAVLGIIITILITITNNYLKQILGSQPTLAVIISALPVAASFNPIRTRLQALVDRYFKPEQVDFSKTFLEFKSDVRTLFTPTELMDILTRRVTAQLNISHSAVFAAHQDRFIQVMPPRPTESAPKLPITAEMQKLVEKGKIVIPDEEGELPFSMLVPLTAPHHGAPRLIGIMALGSRFNEQGYPTLVQEALQKLGEEAGTAIYIAQLHQQRSNVQR